MRTERHVQVILARHPGMWLPEETPEQAEERRDAMQRASGLCRCVCGYEYYEHPQDQRYEWLNVLCSGARVKL